jgi:hypothetical protein
MRPTTPAIMGMLKRCIDPVIRRVGLQYFAASSNGEPDAFRY